MPRKKDKTFLFHHDWFDAISSLPDEIRLKIYDAICIYAVEGKEPEENDVKIAMAMIKSVMILDQEKEAEKSERQRKNVEKRWKKGIPRYTTVYDGRDTTVYHGIPKKDTTVYHGIPRYPSESSVLDQQSGKTDQQNFSRHIINNQDYTNTILRGSNGSILQTKDNYDDVNNSFLCATFFSSDGEKDINAAIVEIEKLIIGTTREEALLRMTGLQSIRPIVEDFVLFQIGTKGKINAADATDLMAWIISYARKHDWSKRREEEENKPKPKPIWHEDTRKHSDKAGIDIYNWMGEWYECPSDAPQRTKPEEAWSPSRKKWYVPNYAID